MFIFLPPAFPIFLFFSFCIHWQNPQLSLVSVVYIPSWLELQKCKWAPWECSLSVVAEMAPVRRGAGGRTSGVHGDPAVPQSWRSQQMLEELFYGLNIHILRSEPTTVSVWATNKQLCASYFGKKNPEMNRGRVKDIMGSNRKEVVFHSVGFWAEPAHGCRAGVWLPFRLLRDKYTTGRSCSCSLPENFRHLFHGTLA